MFNLKFLAKLSVLAPSRLSVSVLSFGAVIMLASCSVRKSVVTSPGLLETLINDSSLRTAHVGVAVYDPIEKKYLYDYQGDKYFVPASNTKIPTLYAALKYLGDSIRSVTVEEFGTYIQVRPAGDPTVLHKDFRHQPFVNYLRSIDHFKKDIWFADSNTVTGLGTGWTWNDYDAAYMAERSSFPVFGNIVSFSGGRDSVKVIPGFFKNSAQLLSTPGGLVNRVSRSQYSNEFTVMAYGKSPQNIQVPFITSSDLSVKLIRDSLKLLSKMVLPGSPPMIKPSIPETPKRFDIYSQPVDSVLKPLMHRSDNFFAEQILLMAANEFLGVMDERRIIDTLLKTDFTDLPQRPRWADGSGLSRYNLFSPKDFIAILEKMNTRFGIERARRIFATGNQGTLVNYYKSDSTFLYAKTGTLSGVVALSGFMYSAENKLLYFSVLVNNHQASATQVRRAVEKFIQQVRKDH